MRAFTKARLILFVAALAALSTLPALPTAGTAAPLRRAHDGATSNVYVIDVASGRQQALTHNRHGEEDALAFSPELSPNGRRLVFAETRCHYCSSFIRVATLGESNWLGRAIAPGFKPSWSPDGRRLVFVRPDGAIAVTTGRLARPVVIVRGGLANDRPSWSRDGKRLVFTRQLTAASWQIFTAHRDGSGLFQVTRGERSALDPAWAPDGDRLAFARQRVGGRWQLCIGNRTGRLIRCFDSSASDTQPAWSRDGRWLAFVRQTQNGSAIWIMRSNGKEARRVAPPVPAGMIVLQPSWSTDARKLLFVGRSN